jgi:hypothetical protein
MSIEDFWMISVTRKGRKRTPWEIGVDIPRVGETGQIRKLKRNLVV